MRAIASSIYTFASIILLGGCGVTTASLPEIWDKASDVDSTYHMEVQIKHAIYCQLRYAVRDVRQYRNQPERSYNGQIITTEEDIFLPESWGVLVYLSLQADEKSALTPAVQLKEPIDGALSGFRVGPASIAQSYSLGLGGSATSQNQRYNRYSFYYAVRDLSLPIESGSVCVDPPKTLGPQPTRSSPLVNGSDLGIREWLLSAVRVLDYRRSSRKSPTGLGAPLGPPSGDKQADSSTYSNKFIVVSSANIAPSWNLIRIGTPNTPLFDASRTRTHEVVISIGPGALERSSTLAGQSVLTPVPSLGLSNAQLAAQIGSAVANALR